MYKAIFDTQETVGIGTYSYEYFQLLILPSLLISFLTLPHLF